MLFLAKNFWSITHFSQTWETSVQRRTMRRETKSIFGSIPKKDVLQIYFKFNLNVCTPARRDSSNKTQFYRQEDIRSVSKMPNVINTKQWMFLLFWICSIANTKILFLITIMIKSCLSGSTMTHFQKKSIKIGRQKRMNKCSYWATFLSDLYLFNPTPSTVYCFMLTGFWFLMIFVSIKLIFAFVWRTLQFELLRRTN
jgi:hypothetical protein